MKTSQSQGEFTSVTPQEAKRRLVEGNGRFASSVVSIDSLRSQSLRTELAGRKQTPFAIILCCSDSRAPAEILFDQGLGDLFVVRVAGNIVAPSLVGSVEFAAATFGVRLVVVMGHTGCGAVAATIDSLKTGNSSVSENIQDIIGRISPHIAPLVTHAHAHNTAGDLMEEATRANIRASVSELKHGSRVLEKMVSSGQVEVIGAEYNLATGKVEFLD